MDLVVSDASPIRAYAHLNRFDILASLFGKVLVPPEVIQELEHPTSKLPPLSVAGVTPFVVQSPIDTEAVEKFKQSLDLGESEALALAKELGAAILIDERAGRRAASAAGLTTIGTLGTLLLAKRNALIPSLRPLMEKLRDEMRFYIAPEVFADLLSRAGESGRL